MPLRTSFSRGMGIAIDQALDGREMEIARHALDELVEKPATDFVRRLVAGI